MVNTTEPGHWLDPGNVHRSIVQDGDDIYVQSDGYGTGTFPEINARLAKLLWPYVDDDIRRELMLHHNAQNHVFGFRSPDEMSGTGAENAGAGTQTRESTAAPRARSVFETGAAPFIPSPSMSMGQSGTTASWPSDSSGPGVSGTTFQDRFFPATSPPPGGLPGLLASVAGIDPANPFLPVPPVDKVSTRRLIGRLVE